MQEERDELVKLVFPQLRKLCENRCVTWGEVDLRWGITDEQRAEGKVLPICLAEICNCRPYFIGLLGERYGWIPMRIPQELIAMEPWLTEHQGRSVTELEILHGVLNNPTMTGQAFFYFRSPAYVDTLPAMEQRFFREAPSREEVEELGLAAAEGRAADRRIKLEALKTRIRQSGFPVREDYPNPRTLGRLVLEDLERVINDTFPEGSEPSPLDREAAEHDAFSLSRTRVYIGGERYFPRLDEHTRGDGLPMVILGGSGSGKSALIANWVERYRVAHPGEAVILHFIGAAAQSADWAAMLRRILGELRRQLGVEVEVPNAPEALRATFANALQMAAVRGRVLLVLDALNQLEDRDQALDLVWLPPEIPAGVRLILSTLPGRPLADLHRRGWPTLRVEPLTSEERGKLIQDYLALSGKALSPERAARIAAAPAAANPLYLRALLDELRLWGEHERLDERIEHYLAAVEIDELYERILERFEEDYEGDRPGLVREAFSLLWSARWGLSEAEVLGLLGGDGHPLPGAHWSPLFLAAETALVNRSGLLGFFHDFLRRAVRHRYLPTPEAQRSVHLRLADYFAARDAGPRQVDELPWQLAEAHSWDRLADLLADLPFFSAAWERNEFEVMAYWAQIEERSERRLVEAYRPVLDAPERFALEARGVTTLFARSRYPEEALSLATSLANHFRKTGALESLVLALNDQASILGDGGRNLHRALSILKEQERTCRQLGKVVGLGYALGDQANILFDLGDLKSAMTLYRERERLCREVEDRKGLAQALGGQAMILRACGDLEGAMALREQEERIFRELGDKYALSVSLAGRALIIEEQGELSGSLAVQEEVEHICRGLGNKAGLQASLGNQALIHEALGDSDRAMILHKEKERICRELGRADGIAISLINQALCLARLGRPDEALILAEEALRVASQHGLTRLVDSIQSHIEHVKNMEPKARRRWWRGK